MANSETKSKSFELTPEQEASLDDMAEKLGNYPLAYKELGYPSPYDEKPASRYEGLELPTDVNDSKAGKQLMARRVLGALNLLSGTKISLGLAKADENLLEKVAYIDPLVIKRGKERVKEVEGRVDKMLRRALGSKAIELVLGERFDINENPDVVGFVKNRLYGSEENGKVRSKVRRELTKMADIPKKKKSNK